MRKSTQYGKFFILCTLAIVLSSCYHAKITTDKAPSNQVIEKPWASSFVFGLVPPSTVETADKCPNGVSIVETQISFLNGLVSGLTFNLYTPMHIKVTCAEAGAASLEMDNEDNIAISKNSSKEEKTEAFQQASEKSYLSGEAVYVTME